MNDITLKNCIDSIDFKNLGIEMHALMTELFPICRSITGNGIRETFKKIKQHIPIETYEVPSGTKVFDWIVPKEWNIKDAYIKDSKGEKIVDFQKNNLHVLNYSVPVNKTLSLKQVKKHLFTIPEHPEWIPYRTSYYHEEWGFCISHRHLESLKEDTYEVVIDSSLDDGHLTYGEYFIKGALEDEVLISVHACHPSLCNDNLSGIVLAVSIAKILSNIPLRYSYRFLFIPGTIGSITWLSINQQNVSRIRHGLVAVCLGDPSAFTYKRSRRHNAEIDAISTYVLEQSDYDYKIIDFFPYGYDERQYCSPGFDLPVGCLMRGQHGQFPEYHTSADDLEFVRPENLAESITVFLEVLFVLENNKKFINQNPMCEPQLGRRGLYSLIGGHDDSRSFQMALLWVLNLSDGHCTLLDITVRAGLGFRLINEAAETLVEHGLLTESY